MLNIQCFRFYSLSTIGLSGPSRKALTSMPNVKHMSSDLKVSSVVRVDKCFAGPAPKVLLGAEHPDPYPAKHLCLCLSWSGRAGLTNICALVFAMKPLLAQWLTCLKLSTCLCILQDQTNSILEQVLCNYMILYEFSIFWLFLTEQMILVAVISRIRGLCSKMLYAIFTFIFQIPAKFSKILLWTRSPIVQT